MTATVATNVRKLGVFGGTFDPVHRAHVALALTVQKKLQLDEVRFFPCGNPPHREMSATGDTDRLAMLELAISDYPGLTLDDWELHQADTTYTYKTLTHLSKLGNFQLFFLMGLDSLQQFTSWRNWQGILEVCHLAVVKRPGLEPGAIPEALRLRVADIQTLSKDQAGRIYFVDFDEMPISATTIRRQINQGSCTADSMEPAVLQYIKEKRLYQNV